jgi:hypothetical protein
VLIYSLYGIFGFTSGAKSFDYLAKPKMILLNLRIVGSN